MEQGEVEVTICECCGEEIDVGEVQKCEWCGRDGLGNCCIAKEEHGCDEDFGL